MQTRAFLKLDKKYCTILPRAKHLSVKGLIDNRWHALEAVSERRAIHKLNAYFFLQKTKSECKYLILKSYCWEENAFKALFIPLLSNMSDTTISQTPLYHSVWINAIFGDFPPQFTLIEVLYWINHRQPHTPKVTDGQTLQIKIMRMNGFVLSNCICPK